MINQINEQIKLWLVDIVKNINVEFCVPAIAHDNDCICVYLSSLEKLMGNTNPTYTQVKLNYLITVHSASIERSHDVISKLLMSGCDHPVFHLLPDTLSVDYWQALKLFPQPVFSLIYLLDIPKTGEEAPLIKEEPNIVTTPMVPIYGKLTGFNNEPLERCRVELNSGQRSVLTDQKGFFNLGLVPSASDTIINIYTKKDNQRYSYKHNKYNGKEIPISLKKLEDSNA